MKQKTFEYNLQNKIIPIAQNILSSSGSHFPAIFTYDSDGIERMAELSKVFSYEDKNIIYGIISRYLKDSKSQAFILINDAWISKYKKDKIVKQKQDCLVFQYQYKDNIKDKKVSLAGAISYEYENIENNIIIDYHNPNVFKNKIGKSTSRLDNIF
jgi:hypothetical protein|tara:strand:- start:5894 stop:6361 length:468 start_codon:yes stop_codon:yes gene_type:complete